MNRNIDKERMKSEIIYQNRNEFIEKCVGLMAIENFGQIQVLDRCQSTKAVRNILASVFECNFAGFAWIEFVYGENKLPSVKVKSQ